MKKPRRVVVMATTEGRYVHSAGDTYVYITPYVYSPDYSFVYLQGDQSHINNGDLLVLEEVGEVVVDMTEHNICYWKIVKDE